MCHTFPFVSVTPGATTGEFPFVDGTARDMTKAEFLTLHHLSEAAYRMVSKSSIDEIKGILIAEHNDVAGTHRESTPRDTLEYMRTQLKRMCSEGGISFPPDTSEITDKARAIIANSTTMTKSVYYARLKLALLPEELWLKLCEVWRKNANFELAGQKRGKGKMTAAAEIQIKPLEAMAAKLSHGTIDSLLDAIIWGGIKVGDLKAHTNAAALKERNTSSIYYVLFIPFV